MQSSLPSQFRGQLSNSGFFHRYKLNSKLNSYYLGGDFNGDGPLDYAISVIDRETTKYPIAKLIDPNNYVLIGADVNLSNIEMDDLKWIDALSIYNEQHVEMDVEEAEKVSLNSESILAIKTESASGIIYWNSSEFPWYQQGH